MLHKLRDRIHSDETGFTLIELLVVILIIGILAAIALPSFLNQRAKAQDAEAKSAVRNAQTAIETYHTDNGTYAGATPEILKTIDPSLREANDLKVPGFSAPSGWGARPLTTTSFSVSVTTKASPETTFIILREADGRRVRECYPPVGGRCNYNW